jgi:hypothetical protein
MLIHLIRLYLCRVRRPSRVFIGLVLAWFALHLAVAVAAPLVNPQAVNLVCTASGALRAVPGQGDEGQAQSNQIMSCPMCMLLDAPGESDVAAAWAVQQWDAPRVPVAKVAPILRVRATPISARGPPFSS